MMPSSSAALRSGVAASAEMLSVSRTIAMTASPARAQGLFISRKSALPCCDSFTLSILHARAPARVGTPQRDAQVPRGREGLTDDGRACEMGGGAAHLHRLGRVAVLGFGDERSDGVDEREAQQVVAGTRDEAVDEGGDVLFLEAAVEARRLVGLHLHGNGPSCHAVRPHAGAPDPPETPTRPCVRAGRLSRGCMAPASSAARAGVLLPYGVAWGRSAGSGC